MIVQLHRYLPVLVLTIFFLLLRRLERVSDLVKKCHGPDRKYGPSRPMLGLSSGGSGRRTVTDFPSEDRFRSLSVRLDRSM